MILCAAWSGRSENKTFAGQTLTKDAQSKRIARNLIDYLLRRVNDTDLDFSNQTNWPRNIRNDNNPKFIAMTKINRFISIYKVAEHQVLDYSPYTTNKTTIDTWFGNVARLC